MKRECSNIPSEMASSRACEYCKVQNQQEHTVQNEKYPRNVNIDFNVSSLKPSRSNFESDKKAQFIRVNNDTCPAVLDDFFTKDWKLGKPNLLISVIGGFTDNEMKPTLKEVFKRGLIKTAQNPGVWIITDGINSGVTKVVREAVRDYEISKRSQQSNVVNLGFANWGEICKPERDKMSNDPKCVRLYADELDHLSCLDFNHSHFILVENGTTGQFGVEIDLRVKLETLISKKHVGGDVKNVQVPVVRLVVAEEPDTLRKMKTSMDNGIPCVVIAGTGKIADVICEIYYLHKDEVTDDIVKEKLQNHFPEESETRSQIQKIMSMKHLLTIFQGERDYEHEIDIAIIKALLKARKNEDGGIKHLLELAVICNQPDIAKKIIVTNYGNDQGFVENLYQMHKRLAKHMITVLVNNRYQFVQLFLDNGLKLKELFLNNLSLKELYQHLPKPDLLLKIMRDMTQEASHDKTDYDQSVVIRQLLEKRVDLLSSQAHSQEGDGSKEKSHDSNIEHEWVLFIWSILLWRKEMSFIFWRKCKNCTAAALIATWMLKTMAKHMETPKSILELADEYEKRAFGMFDHCFKENEEKAEELLIQPLDIWGGRTCLDLAHKADAKDFFAQSGVQNLLTQKWYGEMSDTVQMWRVITCVMFPPLIFTPFLTFRQRVSKEKEMVNEQTSENPEDIPMSEFPLRQRESTEEEMVNKQTSENLEDVPRTKTAPGDGFIQRWIHFWGAPITIFFSNLASELIFLCIYASVILTDIHPWPTGPGWLEILLYTWLIAFITEEFRQILMDTHKFGMQNGLEHYIASFWNKLDLLISVLIVVGMACRLVPTDWNPKAFTVGRIIFSLNFVICCVRLLHIFPMSKTLGPKIIIIRKMVKDLIFFLFLLMLCIFAYGVSTQSLLVRNEKDSLLNGIFSRPYLIIFGEFPEGILDSANVSCTTNGSDSENSHCLKKEINILIILSTFIYLLFANILILNLLIAIFNFTVQTVHKNDGEVWKYQRYELLQEYNSKSPLPPPFNIFSHAHLLVQYLRKRLPRQGSWIPMYKKEELFAWEECMKKKIIFAGEPNKSQMPEEIIRLTAEKVGTLEKRRVTEEDKILSLHQKMENIEQQVARLPQAFEDKGLTPRNTSSPFRVGTLEKRRVTEEDKILSLHQKMENIDELKQQVARLAQAIEDKGLTPRNTSSPFR